MTKKARVNQSDLATLISERCDNAYYEHEILDVLDLLWEEIQEQVMQGNEVSIQGFGVFRLFKNKDKRISNPITREPMIIPSWTSLKFTASQKVKDKVRNMNQEENV